MIPLSSTSKGEETTRVGSMGEDGMEWAASSSGFEAGGPALFPYIGRMCVVSGFGVDFRIIMSSERRCWVSNANPVVLAIKSTELCVSWPTSSRSVTFGKRCRNAITDTRNMARSNLSYREAQVTTYCTCMVPRLGCSQADWVLTTLILSALRRHQPRGHTAKSCGIICVVRKETSPDPAFLFRGCVR